MNAVVISNHNLIAVHIRRRACVILYVWIIGVAYITCISIIACDNQRTFRTSDGHRVICCGILNLLTAHSNGVNTRLGCYLKAASGSIITFINNLVTHTFRRTFIGICWWLYRINRNVNYRNTIRMTINGNG